MLKQRKNLLINIIIAICIVVFLYKFYGNNMSDNPEFRKGTVTFIRNSNPFYELDVKLANTVAQRTRGLMFVKEMPEEEGMIFIYDTESVKRMWMKNTFIPLDMIFIDSSFKIKHIVSGTTPESLTQIPSIVPVKYVIEVNSGFSRRHNINVNDKIEISLED